VWEVFGALPFIYAPSSLALAMELAVPISLGVAVFLAEWTARCCAR
jgi:ABC-type phosphate transport system permease subunit